MKKRKNDSPELIAIREEGERYRARQAWEAKLNAIIGSLPNKARAIAYTGGELYLYYKPSKDGAWGDLTIAADAPEGFELGDARPCHHIAYDRLTAYYRDTIRMLPICGD